MLYESGIVPKIEQLRDTDISTPAEGDLFQYNGSTNKWVNSSDVWSTMSQNGAHNYFYYDLGFVKSNNTSGTWSGNAYTKDGITYTFNADYSITIQGQYTGSSNTSIALCGRTYKNFRIVAGDYIFSSEYGNANVFLTIGTGDTGDGSTGSWVELATTKNGESDFTVGEKYCGVTITVAQGTNISTAVTLKPMIRLATDANTDYTPYAPTNRDLAYVLPTIKKNGAYNLLENTATSQVLQGVTFTVNPTGYKKGAIKLYSTAAPTGGVDFKVNAGFKLPAGTYKLVPNDFPSTSYNARISVTITGGAEVAWDANYDNHAHCEFTLSEEKELVYHIYMNTNAIGALNNIIIYPMITTDMNATSADFEEYAMTNRELTEVKTLTPTAINTTSNATVIGISAVRVGKIVQYTLTIKTTAAVNVGGNIKFTHTNLPLPVSQSVFAGYSSSTAGIAQMDVLGELTIRILAANLPNDSYLNILGTYICK